MYKLNNFNKLLMPWISINTIPSIMLTDIVLDSRKITWGSLFVAVKGYQTDGRLYIEEAIKKGAVAILSESLNQIEGIKKYNFNINNVPVIFMKNLSRYLSDIAARFYNNPSYLLDVIGVTGTNGKTTVTCLLANWMQLLGEKSAVMGTLGNGIWDDSIYPSSNTTCSAIDIQKILALYVQHKVTCVSMEVSSHGLDQYRVDNIYFKAAIFTNLSRDHLDYHNSFIKYMMAKRRLFDELRVENYIINADDLYGYRWLSYLPQSVAVTVVGNLPPYWKGKWICVINVRYCLYSTKIIFDSSWGRGVIHSQLLGVFNVINLLLALGTLLVLGYPLSLLLYTAPRLRPVCGRMEVFRSFGSFPMVVIDYAHTPEALKQVLISIKKYYCRGKLWCIFGCGGNRDLGKRAMMGIIAVRYSDCVIITNDNPRTEDPQVIVNNIIHNSIKYSPKIVKIVKDRSYAIYTAIMQAVAEDVVLIAGKGHEINQIIGQDYIYHSDRDVVKNFLGDYRLLNDSI